MSGKKLLLSLVLPVLLIGGTAFGWAGTTHSLLCQRNFDLPVVSQFLGGVDQSAIENYIGEPDGHNQQWISMTNRSYIDTAPPISGFDWNAMDETTRLKTLMHHAGDVSVPAHHPPAGEVYDSTFAEGLCEVAAAGGYLTVGELPNVASTTSYTHSRNGHSYNFTGTINQVVSTYYNACRDNASWYKSTKKWYGHNASDIASANWNGLKIDLMLQRAVFVDYFLAKEYPELTAGNYVGYTGGSVTFDQSDSYDPDCISWNSNGTYTQIIGNHDQGMVSYMWDLNADAFSGGEWDFFSSTPYLTLSTAELLAFGLTPNQWNLYYVAGWDNEGKAGVAAGYVWAFGGGAVPEPATLSLLALGGLALLRRRSR
jgi:hypothetical protein